ncbi:lipase [Pseudomonas chlororaphis]|uniref:lipase family protein n=1 Tax=Pseudomonas chlororaphis TaxID=587753 RepID=UPI000789EDBE|nr:lipase family protein [Pseudomonas chlororaphis]AMS16094.1 lipase [Pseudomonas chlororaphis]
MSSYKPMEDWEKPSFSGKMFACPLQGQWISFQLVDEFGDGKPYAGLAYILQDSAKQQYIGMLDAEGYAKVHDCYRGPVVLMLDNEYQGGIDTWYEKNVDRKSYPLPITELQVRAEQTRFFHEDGVRVEHNPAQKGADKFIQVEVRDLVKQVAHLPPVVDRKYPPDDILTRALDELSFGPEPLSQFGVGLMPNEHTVLEVRPLRALRPLLSTDNAFSALNLYQLAIMADLSYSDFGQDPQKPVDYVRFPDDPSVGNFFGEALSNFRESWKVDRAQSPIHRCFPLYEEVPYSKRFEILPFDPAVYEQNRPGDKQEDPSKLHFFDDKNKFWFSGKSTQAYITHHDEIILIGVRGTLELSDWWRDADAAQVPFEEGKGKVHHGFYDAYKALKKFIQDYLDQFHIGQKIIICGHSLGGAIALLLAEALRQAPDNDYDILLYTYGSPRAADAEFVAAASALPHHRMVNNNDIVPGVPAPWMNVRRTIWLPGLASVFITNPFLGILIFAVGLVRIGGAPYEHHGVLHHFMPVDFTGKEKSAILWTPCAASIEDAACTRAIAKDGDLPIRDNFIMQAMQTGDHSAPHSYIPFAWATLRRWQQTLEHGETVVTKREYDLVKAALENMQSKVQDECKQQMDTRRYQNNDRQCHRTVSELSEESQKLSITIERLEMQYKRHLTLADVYGSAAQSPALEAALKRWMAKKENTTQVQIAMIPRQFDDDLMIASRTGASYTLDIDSIV